MKSPNNLYSEPKKIVVPVTVRAGELKPFYGGEMPKLREGIIGDLVVDVEAFVNQSDIERFDAEDTSVLLESGEPLFAVMGLRDTARTDAVDIVARPPLTGDSIFVQFTLKAQLTLHLRGTKLAELQECPCVLPTLGLEVSSVNHAYTKLSERYEPWRRSHTGNVFQKVYYLDKDVARPLDELRKRATAKFEKKLFHLSETLPLENRVREENS